MDRVAIKNEIFDIRPQIIIVDQGMDRIDPRFGAGQFCDRIARIINIIGIVTFTPGHVVSASAAINDIVSIIANEDIVTSIACCVDIGGRVRPPGVQKGHVLHIRKRSERKSDIGLNRVRA